MTHRDLSQPVSLRPRRLLAVLLCLGLLASLPALAKMAKKQGKAEPEAVADPPDKPIKRLIGAVRYNKDDLALAQLDGEAQGAFLLEKAWVTATAEQKAAFVRDFHAMFSAIAFPRIRKNFEKLETVLYDPPAIKGDQATIASTIVILHPLKKQEIRATYDMHKVGGEWKVVDVTVKGDKSMLTNIRNDQIRPILAEGGVTKLLDLLAKRVAQLRSKK